MSLEMNYINGSAAFAIRRRFDSRKRYGVLAPGDVPDGLYIVISGRLRLLGDATRFDDLLPRDSLGETSLLLDAATRFSVDVLEPSKLLTNHTSQSTWYSVRCAR